jgi:hypothetical protein
VEGAGFDIRPGSYNTDRSIEVLGELHRFLDGEEVTLVWDNLSAHTSRTMRTRIRAAGWLPYAFARRCGIWFW